MAVSEARIPSLCSSRSSFSPGLSRSTMNDLIAARPFDAVERGPDDDQVGAVAGGDEDLLAVEDVLVAVELGGGADRGRVRAGLRLGDRHRRPLAAVALELLVGRDRGDRRVAEALARHREQQADVAPAELDDAEHGREVGAVAVALVRRRLARGARRRRRRRRCRRPRSSPSISDGEHVELLRIGVLGLVVLARDRPEHLGRDLVAPGSTRGLNFFGISRLIMGLVFSFVGCR